MASNNPDGFELVFWETLREGLMNRDSISVSGLGVFEIIHESGQLDVDDVESGSDGSDTPVSGDGSILVSPPRDFVVFESEFKHAD